MACYQPAPVLGLTAASSNQEIQEKAFDFAVDTGYMVFASTALNGTDPTARALEIHYLDDQKNLYIGMAKGKPCYLELKRYPMVTGIAVRETVNRLSVSVRITAHVTEIDPQESPQIYARYWKQNPGTAALYRKDLDMFRIFLLDRGDGEIFHLPEPDVTCRVRFGFGGASPRPWAYAIDPASCTGCGACQEACMENVIHPTPEGTYSIDYFMCLECGRCAMVCPSGAAKFQENSSK